MALDFGLGKVVTKAAMKGFAKEALPVIAKEVAEQTFKTIDVTSKEALGNLGRHKTYKNLAIQSQQAISNHIEKLPSNAIQSESKAIESIFQKIEGSDLDLQNVGWRELDDTVHALGAVDEAGHKAMQYQAKMDEVRGKTPTDTKVTADFLISQLETKKAAWKAKYQTGDTGFVQPPTIEQARAGEKFEVPIASGNRDELMRDLQEYITSNEQIAKLTNNKGLLQQPKKGWQEIFGNVLDEKGFPMRLDGGREASTGPFKFTSSADNLTRKWNENVYIPSENPKRKTFIRKAAKKAGVKVHKHHVTGIEQTSPWGFLNDGTPRSAEDIEIIEAIVKKEVGVEIGNKDINETYPTDTAHLGKKGDPVSSAFAVHRLLDQISDLQGFGDWVFEASSIKFQMPPGSKPKVKWFKNANGLLSDIKTGREIGDLNTFKSQYAKKVDGKVIKPEAINFKVGDSPGTYNITKGVAQKSGFSNELLATISRIQDPELAGETLVLFLRDSGAAETMEAAAALAFRVVDHGITEDEITKTFAKKHSPQMIELAKRLLDGEDPLYKDNPILKGVIRAEESALALRTKLGI